MQREHPEFRLTGGEADPHWRRAVASHAGGGEALRGSPKRVDFRPVPVDRRIRTVRSLPHGHVAPALGSPLKIGVSETLAIQPSRDLALVWG